MPSTTKAERAEAVARLREWIKPGDTIHCVLRHVSRSGMQRVIQLVKLETEHRGSVSDGTYRAEVRDIHIGWTAATALGMRYDRQREGVVIGGCGMDMGFALVYDLARTLWPDGYGCIGEGCPSNDHSNRHVETRDCECKPHAEAAGAPYCEECGGKGEQIWHRDGGYALRQRWL